MKTKVITIILRLPRKCYTKKEIKKYRWDTQWMHHRKCFFNSQKRKKKKREKSRVLLLNEKVPLSSSRKFQEIKNIFKKIIYWGGSQLVFSFSSLNIYLFVWKYMTRDIAENFAFLFFLINQTKVKLSSTEPVAIEGNVGAWLLLYSPLLQNSMAWRETFSTYAIAAWNTALALERHRLTQKIFSLRLI